MAIAPSGVAQAALQLPITVPLRNCEQSGDWRKRMGIEPTLAERSPTELRF